MIRLTVKRGLLKMDGSGEENTVPYYVYIPENTVIERDHDGSLSFPELKGVGPLQIKNIVDCDDWDEEELRREIIENIRYYKKKNTTKEEEIHENIVGKMLRDEACKLFEYSTSWKDLSEDSQRINKLIAIYSMLGGIQ